MKTMTLDKEVGFLYLHVPDRSRPPKVFSKSLLFLLSPWITKYTTNYHLNTNETQTHVWLWPLSQMLGFNLNISCISNATSELLFFTCYMSSPKAGPSAAQFPRPVFISHDFLSFTPLLPPPNQSEGVKKDFPFYFTPFCITWTSTICTCNSHNLKATDSTERNKC